MANTDKIIEEIKKGLTGEPGADIQYLQEQGLKYQHHPDASEILQRLSNVALELVPEETRNNLLKTMIIDGKRLDQVFNDANTLVKQKNIDGAIALLDKIEEKADMFAENAERVKRFSFRNRLDEYIYINMYNPEQRYERTPFNFCQYMSAYGYLLVEKRMPEEAVKKLEKAIDFNPVNVEPRFELAEAYKLMREADKLIDCTNETLKISATPYHISRCYTNLGYACIEKKDYDSAICFYYESLVYAKNPAVQGELQHIRMLTGKKITPPSDEDISGAFEKYGIKRGPSQVVVNTAYSLGNYCMEHNAPPEESMLYMQIAYNLTNSENIKEIIDRLNAQIAARNARVK